MSKQKKADDDEAAIKAAVEAGTMRIGGVYYFVEHAYYHWIGEVVAITGRREVILRHVRRIHSCARDFTAFFRDGAKNDTVYTIWPDGHNVSNWMTATPWPHAIPGEQS